MVEKEYYSPLEVSKMLGVSKLTVYRMCKRGDIPHSRVGKGQRIRIKKTDVDTYMEQSKTPAKGEK